MERQTFREQVRGMIILIVCAFALLMLCVAPLELHAVYRVRSWTPVQAKFIAAYTEQLHWKGIHEATRYEFTDTETNEIIHVGDARPGDMPFAISLFNRTWRTGRADIKKYQGNPIVTVYRSPDGKDYFLEQGSYGFMSLVLVASLAWWIGILTRLKPYQKK